MLLVSSFCAYFGEKIVLLLVSGFCTCFGKRYGQAFLYNNGKHS